MASVNGLLIDYEWCSGCQSCEIACRNEHGWDLTTDGIRVLEFGPSKMTAQKNLEWNYVPTPSTLCDLCEDRVARGEVPSCQLHCLAGVITYGSIEELSKKAANAAEAGKRKLSIIIP